MTYIYDLLINLNDFVYSFYEWRETDEIEYLKKSVLLKVSDYMYSKFISSNIILGDKTLSILKDKSCILKSKKMETITYMGVFTNGKDVIGITFSSNGEILEKTRFTLQDELELLEMAKQLKTVKIDYKKITNRKFEYNFNSRDDRETIKYIVSELDKIKNDSSKIDYLYYEWFNKKSESNDTFFELISDIKNSYNEKRADFLKLLNLVTIKNNV